MTSELQHAEVGDSRFSLLVYRFCRRVLLMTLFPFYNVKVTGREWMSMDGPMIVAPVHRSNLDTPIVNAISRRRVRSLAKATLFKGWFWTWFLSALGGFPVERGTADRAALGTARMLLDRGEPLLVFPEGTRQHGHVVQPLFDGAAYLSAKTGAPVVPVGVAGTEGALPSGSKIPKRTKVRVVVGEPMLPPTSEKGRLTRSQRTEFTEQLRTRLQELYDQARAQAEA